MKGYSVRQTERFYRKFWEKVNAVYDGGCAFGIDTSTGWATALLRINEMRRTARTVAYCRKRDGVK